jgi:FkbM family methyltransferase
MIKRFVIFTPLLFLLSKIKSYAHQIVWLPLKTIKWLIRPVMLRIRNYLVNVSVQTLQLHQRELQSQIDRIERYSLKASRQFAINYDHETMIVRTELGFIAFASDVPILGSLLEDDLEIGTRRLIQKYLKPGNVFVDVGANMGIHTLAAANVMQKQGKIYAFEPHEETARLLKKTALFNSHLDIIEIHTAAVSNRTGYQKLFLAKTSGLHSLFPLTGAYAENVPPIEVPVVKLDDVLNNTVDLIKSTLKDQK